MFAPDSGCVFAVPDSWSLIVLVKVLRSTDDIAFTFSWKAAEVSVNERIPRTNPSNSFWFQLTTHCFANVMPWNPVLTAFFELPDPRQKIIRFSQSVDFRHSRYIGLSIRECLPLIADAPPSVGPFTHTLENSAQNRPPSKRVSSSCEHSSSA